VRDKIVIQGGGRLKGRVNISGAKNAALPIIAACILTQGTSRIKGIPRQLTDVKLMEELLCFLGLQVNHSGEGVLEICTEKENLVTAPYELVNEMRGSICVLGPLLVSRGKAKVALPGGCVIGQRPIDLHVKGLQTLGAEISFKDGYVVAKADKLKGAEIYLGGAYGSTVLGTCNIMMAATLAEGTTVIESAACEPEVQDLANFLIQAGAKISGVGTNRLIIEGVKELHSVDYQIIPDRIEAGTFMAAAAITKGDVVLENVRLDHLGAVTEKFREIGVEITQELWGCSVKGGDNILSTSITTLPYPGLPTDMQPQLMSLLSIAQGTSVITEKVFPDRFMHIAELNRMGASIRKEGPSAIVNGVPHLSGTQVTASDLRAGAALVLAGLVAKGTTEISGLHYLDRGYESLEAKFAQLGARIERVQEQV
jgi:UDP-N-acetylglucosamine 1-carboxyvinyltransferase